MNHVEASTKSVERGLCESPAHIDHRLSIHNGDPVATICWEGRPKRRFVRVRGGINVVPAGAESRWLIEAPTEQLLIRVPYQTFACVAQELGLDRAHVYLEPGYRGRDPRIEHIGRALHLEGLEGHPNGPLFAESLSIAMCTQLIREFAQRAPIPSKQRLTLGPAQYARLIEYIDANLGSAELSLQHLSEVAGVGITQLKSVFHDMTGGPVHRYVVERRVERAAQLLARGVAISDAAAQAGFSHASHMARWMRRLMHVTPSQLSKR